MFRRQLFYGITFILLAVILFLMLRGRSADKDREAQNIKLEEIASDPPAPVRAILPRDLEIVEAKVSLTRNPEKKDDSTAHHDITIRNTGGGSYVGLWLRMEYIDEKGKPVEIRTHEINEALPSEGILRVSDITIDAMPDAAADFRATILSADLDGAQN